MTVGRMTLITIVSGTRCEKQTMLTAIGWTDTALEGQP